MPTSPPLPRFCGNCFRHSGFPVAYPPEALYCPTCRTPLRDIPEAILDQLRAEAWDYESTEAAEGTASGTVTRAESERSLGEPRAEHHALGRVRQAASGASRPTDRLEMVIPLNGGADHFPEKSGKRLNVLWPHPGGETLYRVTTGRSGRNPLYVHAKAEGPDGTVSVSDLLRGAGYEEGDLVRIEVLIPSEQYRVLRKPAGNPIQQLPVRIRRLDRTGTTLYVGFDRDDLARVGIDHGMPAALELPDGKEIQGIVKTSGSTPWLAPTKRNSNKKITEWLRAAGLEHGQDLTLPVRILN